MIHVGPLYGLLVVSVCLLALGSKERTLAAFAFIMLASWGVSNLLVGWVGFRGAPYLAPTADAFLAVLVAGLGYNSAHRQTATWLLYLFALEEIISMAGIAFAQTNTYLYYSLLNVVFLLQVMIVGTSAARRMELVAGAWRSIQRLRHRVFGASEAHKK